MMKQAKSAILLLMAVCIVFGALSLQAEAAEVVDSGTCGDGVTWVLSEDGTLTISGTGEMEDRSRPWRDYEEEITSIVVNEGITAVGSYSFAYLEQVQSVSLPTTLRRIGDSAFRRCTALQSFTIPEGVTTLGKSVFEDCMLESIHLPATLTEMGDLFIFQMPTLKKITVAEGNPLYFTEDGILYKDELPEEPGRAYRAMILCPNDRTSLVIPEGVIALTQASLSCCTMLEDLTLSNGLQIFSPLNINLCTGLQNLYVHDTNRKYSSVDGVLFSKDGLRLEHYPAGRAGAYTVPEGTVTISIGAFWGCGGLTAVKLPDSVTSISQQIFRDCTALKGIRIPDGIGGIPEQAFYGCTSLSTVVLPETVMDIGEHAFHGCESLRNFTLPTELKTIGDYAFSYCVQLTDLTMNDKLTAIGEYAFSGSGLRELVIPGTVESLKDGAFSGAESLSVVHFLGDAPEAGVEVFWNCPEDLELCHGADAQGWDAPDWADYALTVCEYTTTGTEATCTDPGAVTLTCSHCDLCIQRVTQPTGHRFGAATVALEPTENEEGRWERQCTVCGKTESVTIPAAPQQPLLSWNEGDQQYDLFAANPIFSHLIANEDSSCTRVEAWDDGLTVERYDAEFSFVSRKVLPMELPFFGGFYEGTDFYFLVFGQENRNESDAREVIRVVRYTKDWVRQDHVSLYGANTQMPFNGGSLRMVQYGDMLYVHTCHTMYRSYDGRNHQANLMFSVRIPDMKITDQLTDVSNNQYGYVSHSFNQFILTNGDKLITLNHGDGFPRSAVIMQFNTPAGGERFTGHCSYQSILDFCGQTGDNLTGASLGGFHLSDSAYLTAGNSIRQDGTQKPDNFRNIFLGVTTLDTIGEGTSTVKWITNHAVEEEIMTSTPHLVKLGGNRFLLMWTEYTMAGTDDILHYVFVDGNGELLSPIYEADAMLSDCVPVVAENSVCWYVTKNSCPYFYAISLANPEQVLTVIPKDSCANGHTWKPLVTEPTCTEGGYTTYTCFCGESYVDEPTEPLGHDWNQNVCERCGAERENPFADVPESQWYYEPVLWAVEQGITAGTSATGFSPNQTCTRAQVVTFLWRAMGKPAPDSNDNPFADVAAGAYYYDAVLWAVEQGITAGTGKDAFSPDAPCTRGQVVTFLWRAMSRTACDAENPFTDVKAEDYYHTSVLWAVEQGITAGTAPGLFSPGNPCTRAQVVTFLYRAMTNA